MMPPGGQASAALPAATAKSLLRDLPIIVGGMALFYGLVALSHYWTAPVNAQADIQLSSGVLPKYALFSVARILIAYLISLVFAIGYGQFAAHNARAERILIPLLDTLQSIPVLSFLPPVMVAMVALFPTRQFGVELGSILLIFTGQVWNMAFSVYSSTKNIPHELMEAAGVYRLSWWQRFTQLELPCAAIGLVWNSMMSVAGGWFFLMACEAFVLNNRDLRLPGLGSYLQTAANAGDIGAIHVGPGGDDRGYRADGPVDLAPHHRLGREIQIRAGGGGANADLADSHPVPPFARALRHRPQGGGPGDGGCRPVLRAAQREAGPARRPSQAPVDSARAGGVGAWDCVVRRGADGPDAGDHHGARIGRDFPRRGRHFPAGGIHPGAGGPVDHPGRRVCRVCVRDWRPSPNPSRRWPRRCPPPRCSPSCCLP